MSQTQEQMIQDALALFNTMRGKLIIGQALHIAVKELQKVPEPYREKSNIEDMQRLQLIFFPYGLIEEVQRRWVNAPTESK